MPATAAGRKGETSHGGSWGELKRRNVSYKEFAEGPKAHGLNETASGTASKMSRETFAGDVLPGYFGCAGDGGRETGRSIGFRQFGGGLGLCCVGACWIAVLAASFSDGSAFTYT